MADRGVSMDLRLSKGIKRLLKGHPKEILDEMGRRMGKTLLEQGREVIREAKLLAPEDTGELKASGRAELLQSAPLTMGVNLSFGGPPGMGNVDGETNATEVNYAVIQHEDMMLHHPNGGQAKFLETPWLDAQPRKAAAHRRVVRDVLREHDLL